VKRDVTFVAKSSRIYEKHLPSTASSGLALYLNQNQMSDLIREEFVVY